MLPLVQQDRGVGLQELRRVCFGQLLVRSSVQPEDRRGATLRRCGLSHTLGPFERDGRQSNKELVKLVIDDPNHYSIDRSTVEY